MIIFSLYYYKSSTDEDEGVGASKMMPNFFKAEEASNNNF
jgi:hypothetical protein